MFGSIKNRLIAICIAVVVLTLLVSTIANYSVVRSHTNEQITRELDGLASAHAADIGHWVRHQRDIITALLPVTGQADPVPFLVQAAKSGRLDAAYVGFADKRIQFNSPQNLPAGYDPTGRPWYTQAAAASSTIITEPYLDAAKNLLVVTFAQAVKDGGQTKAVVASDVFLDDVVATVKTIKPTSSGFAFLVFKDGRIIAHPDAKLAMKPTTALSKGLDAAMLKQLASSGTQAQVAELPEGKFLLRAAAVPETDWLLVTAAERGEALSSLSSLLRASGLVLLVVSLLAGLVAAFLVSAMLTGLVRVRKAMDEIGSGGGDLTQRLPVTGKDEISQIAASFNLFAEKIAHILMDVRSTSNSISTASSEIAMGAQDLSQRTEQTASNLQQAASSMVELTATVRQTADSARTADQLASSAASAAAKGGQVVSQVVSTMDEINTSSKKISDIIGVIDGIAFQTNILALNAAVEAARAGEQGRGFAVVAGEVRSLAQRSAEAAKEIKTLIGASVERVETGARLVQDAGSSMSEIVSSVQRVTDIIGEITAAASEQSDGISTVNQSVVQLDQMTQQNAALVEESAAAAESLKDQAHRLSQVVGVFRLSDDAAPAAYAQAPRPTAAPKPPAATASAAAKSKSTAAAKRPPATAGTKTHKPAPAPAPVAAPAPAKSSGGGEGDWESF